MLTGDISVSGAMDINYREASGEAFLA
jgi:hypothetical protein